MENKEGWSRVGGTLEGFRAYAVSSPCRTWAQEMGGSRCGPGAHLVHLWPPHFAFSGHHPWDLGPHSGPALVRMGWGENGGGEEATCFLFGSFSISASLCGHLLFISFLCVICLFFVFVFLSCLLLGLVPVCLSGPSTSMSWIQERGGHYCLLAPSPLVFPLLPFLSPPSSQ